jgi:L-lactate utilization protein LutB
MPVKDPEQRRQIAKRWYAKHRETHINRVTERKKRLREELNEYKKTLKCVDCGEDEPHCLDFHHIDPTTKDGHPANMPTNKSWTTKRLIQYLQETCIVLCANCHRKHHAAERREKKTRPKAGKRRGRGTTILSLLGL